MHCKQPESDHLGEALRRIDVCGAFLRSDYFAEPEPARAQLSRDSLLARLSDVLRRSGVEDADVLIAEVERRIPVDDPPQAQSGGRIVAAWIERVGRPVVPVTGPVLTIDD